MTIKTNKTNKPFSFYKEGFISLCALLCSNKLLWSMSQTSLVLGGGVGMVVVVGAKRPPPVKRGLYLGVYEGVLLHEGELSVYISKDFLKPLSH